MISNKAFDELEEFLKDFKLIKTDDNLLNKINIFKNNISKIKDIRVNLLQLKINSNDIIDFYGKNINNLISFFDDLLIYSNSKDLSKSSQAYVSLINVIEKTYSEKNIVKNIFEHSNISNEDYNNFISFVSSQNSYLDVFRKNLSLSQNEFYEKEVKSNSFIEVEKFRELISQKIKKDTYLTEIKDAIGYGGLIHSYKDYVLEQQDKYLNKLQKNHTKLLREIKNYKKLENISNEENVLLDDIQSVFDLYMDRAYDGTNLNEIINDSKAIKALTFLSKNIYGTNVVKWEEVSSQRIESFERIKNKIVDDMIFDIETNVNKLDNQVLLFLSFIIVLIILIFVVITFMTNKISNSIKKFQNNLDDFLLFFTLICKA